MSNETNAHLFEVVWNDFVQNTYSLKTPLHEAIKYCLLGSGKRVRARSAALAFAHYSTFQRSYLSASVAVEMIHAYSLIHDDLPCMDDDDWRRGRPSLHKVFGEATALLAGDAILTDAFRVLTDEDFFPDNQFVPSEIKIKQVGILTRAAGGNGMVLGQSLDLYFTGRHDVTKDILDKIHRGKTGALLGASFALGAAAGGASKKDTDRWYDFGILIGLAFQAIDDTLDDALTTGKTAGKDVEQAKLTYMTFFTKDEVKKKAEVYTHQATSGLPVTPSGELLDFVSALILRIT
jgi:geranylgeranyl pyrophosphate synthase